MNSYTWSILIAVLIILLVFWIAWMLTFRRQRGILGRIFKSTGLEIHIKNQLFRFDSVENFRAFLSGKTEIPSSKMQEMMGRTDQQLEGEIQQLQRIETTITEKLGATIRNPQTIDDYLDDATMVRFSQDYDWRQIMFELSKQTKAYSEYKLEAVTNYLKYIQSRMSVAHTIIRKRKNFEDDGISDKTVLKQTIESHVLEQEKEKENLFISTSLIDLSEDKELSAMSPANAFKRIPRGRTVRIDTTGLKEIPLKIGSRKFTLEFKDGPELVSSKGERYPILAGENLVGRSTKCSIVVNPELVDISRQHVIIEKNEDNTLHFTDISSSGTQLPGNLIKEEI